jgi:two-component system cell cycle sensor histidine kinase/response regulator CckA
MALPVNRNDIHCAPDSPAATAEQLQQMLECLGEGILLGDRNDQIILANKRMAEMIGYAPGELIGRTIHTLLLPSDEAWQLAERTKRRLHGHSDKYEMRLMRRDGSRFWALITATPLRNVNGDIVGTVGAVSDISEQRRAAEALRKSEERFRRLFELPLIGIAITSPTTEWLDVNEKFCTLLGYTREELLEATWPALTHPDDLDKDTTLFREVLSGSREDYSIDKRYIRKDGTPLHCLLSVGCVRKSDRSVDYLIALIQDISERISAECEIRQQKDYLRQIIDANPNLIFVKNETGHFTLVNQAVADIYGTTVAKLLGRCDADFNSDPEQLAQFAAEDQLVLKRGLARTIEEEKVTDARTKEVRWFQTIKKRLKTSPGAAVQLLGVATDITERKRIEAASLQLQRQLYQAQKLEAIGQLAAGVAHDLNNALAAVVGHLQLIQLNTEQKSAAAESSRIALQGCERASSLINQLLGFSRQGRFNLTVLELQQLVRDTLSFLAKILGNHLEIMQETMPIPLMVVADAGQLQQVFTNLIINAKQAMPSGGRLRIAFSRQELSKVDQFNPKALPGTYIRVQVIDSGIGIPEENLDKIFEPFFTTKAAQNGTGLGLPTVYGMLQNHGGWINVESTVGQGTTCNVYLPHASVLHPLPAQIANTDVNRDVTALNIILVDDDKVLLDLSKVFLERAGFSVFAFCDPAQALDWFKLHCASIDLLIVDMKMPSINGAEFFEAARKIDACAQVVILSGYVQDSAAQSLLERGALQFFTKPVKFPELIAWLQNHSQRRAIVA